jgi:glycosyltransferase involved in cell wall biosynthesis
MLTVSLCMIARNEEKYIRRCLESVAGVVDEIIVVDTGSTDQTAEIAAACGANVVHFPWNDDFSAARNYGIDRATGDYILVLDADEELLPASRHRLKETLASQADGYVLRIDNRISTGFVVTSNVLRLFKNRREYRFENRVHEQISTAIARANGVVLHAGHLCIVHYGYAPEEIERKDKRARNRALIESMDYGKDPYYLFQLAQEYALIREYDKACELFGRSIRKVHDHAAFRPDLVCLYMEALVQGARYAEVHRLYEENAGRYPGYVDLVFLDGRAYLGEGKYVKALERFRSCLRSVPDMQYTSKQGVTHFIPLLLMGWAYYEMGEQQTAVELFRRSFLIQPSVDSFMALMRVIGDKPEEFDRCMQELGTVVNLRDPENLQILLIQFLLSRQWKGYRYVKEKYKDVPCDTSVLHFLEERDFEGLSRHCADGSPMPMPLQSILETYKKLKSGKLPETKALREWVRYAGIANVDYDGLSPEQKLAVCHEEYEAGGKEEALARYIDLYRQGIADHRLLARIGEACILRQMHSDGKQFYAMAQSLEPMSFTTFRLSEAAVREGDRETAELHARNGLAWFPESLLLQQLTDIIEKLKNKEKMSG